MYTIWPALALTLAFSKVIGLRVKVILSLFFVRFIICSSRVNQN